MISLEVNSEYKKLIEEVNILKEKASSIFEERNFLIYHTCEKNKSKYMNKIGVLEYIQKIFTYLVHTLQVHHTF